MALPACLAAVPDLLEGVIAKAPVASVRHQPPYPVTMNPQERTWWCWAAVAQSVAAGHAIPLDQVDIVAHVKGEQCRIDPGSRHCNDVAEIKVALKTPKILEQVQLLSQDPCESVAIATLTARIAQEAVPCKTKSGDAVHYCLIAGLIETRSQSFLHILDPRCANLLTMPITDSGICGKGGDLKYPMDSVYFLA